jgi:hypothetical protein
MASARAAAASEAALERQQEAIEAQRAITARLQQEVEEAQQEAADAATTAGFGGCPDCAAARAHASHLEVGDTKDHIYHAPLCINLHEHTFHTMTLRSSMPQRVQRHMCRGARQFVSCSYTVNAADFYTHAQAMLLKHHHQHQHQHQHQQPVPAQLRRPLSAASGISSAHRPSSKTGSDARIAAAVARCLDRQAADGNNSRAADEARRQAVTAEAHAEVCL